MKLDKKNRMKTGVILSNKMDKTVTVKIERTHQHPVFGKVIKSWSKVYAHDNDNRCKIGDKVQIEESKPLSKLKRWRVVEVLTT